MPPDLTSGESIPWRIRDLLRDTPRISSGDVARAAGVTRQAAHYHLRRMVDSGELRAVGAGRGSRYEKRASWSRQYETAGLEEHLVWQELLQGPDSVRELSERPMSIARFAFTEMLNNAIDHSGSETVSVSAGVSGDQTLFSITDAGIGAFERVRRTERLDDHIEAIQELAKGKLTSDPARHAGEGIFFTSKAVDVFVMTSNGLRWKVDNPRQDQSIARVLRSAGTQVQFSISPHTQRLLNEVFDQYTEAGTFAFNRSRTVVRLFEYDVAFVSRSEAKRLTRNLEKFAEVIVDFHAVREVGQGFADEVFRVWQQEHRNTRLIPVNMNEFVEALVERARLAGRSNA